MSGDEEPSVFRPDSVSYLRIPAPDPAAASSFYGAVFGWQVRGAGSHRAFTDGSGHVIGHWVDDRRVVGPGAGAIPYIFVDDVAGTLAKVVASGGAVVSEPYPEGNLTVATCSDPAGNEIGIWQLT